MNIEQAFQVELLETSAVTALISTRAYYVKALSDVSLPYLVIHSISNIPVRPYVTAATGKLVTRLQVSIFATTYASCKAISAAIKTAFDGFSGTMGTAGIVVGCCFLDNEYDLPFEDSPIKEGTGIYGIGVDYILHY
jgi:hypothetical protein